MTTQILRRRRDARFTLSSLLDRLISLDSLRRQRADLAALDDRMLRDIGVTREQVDRELRHSRLR